MKKLFAVLLCLLLALSLIGCVEAETPSTTDPSDDGTSETLVAETLTFSESKREDKINWYGRCYHDTGKATVSINNSSSGFEVSFYGTELKAEFIATKSTMNAPELSGNGYLCVFIDGETDFRQAETIELDVTDGSAAEVVLAQGLEKGEHTVKVLKVTEVKYTQAYVKSITSDGGFKAPPEKPSLKLEIIGDSITAGANAMREYSIDVITTDSENSLASYGAIAAARLNAQFNVVCRSGLTVSGGTGGTQYKKLADYYGLYSEKDTVAWDFSEYIPDAVIIDLGTNDKLVNVSDTVIKKAYKEALDTIRSHYPDAYIFCCTGAMGDDTENDYAYQLGVLVGTIADEYNAAGDGKIVHVELSQKTTAGHPKAQTHRTNGLGLVATIRSVMGLN